MMRRNFFIFSLFVIVAISLFAIYSMTNHSLNNGEILMPLDDVYIHFQYARQLANGQPYIYNIGGEPTSGATSFIYPYLLAVGYGLGFKGLQLGLWAMMLGCGALIGAMWAVYRLCIAFAISTRLSIFTAITFACLGSVSWHAMSGMETMLIVCLTLWTWLAFVERRLPLFVVSAVLLALTRPEGSIMAGIASMWYGFRLLLDRTQTLSGRRILLLAIPVMAIGVQPLVNYVLTGSFSASGSQAKSLFGLIPQDWDVILSRILGNLGQFWLEFLTGYSPSQGLWYLVLLTVPLGIIGLLIHLRKADFRWDVLLIVFWMVAVSLAIVTLDTAFWHFKRYQMPLMVLWIPLAVIPIQTIARRFAIGGWIIYGVVGFIAVVFVVMTGRDFLRVYQINIGYVREQPYAMARWLRNNTSTDALIAVHDVGMMRYIGERNTLDIVGLTTPDAAQYWRNGVGSVAEFLLKKRPDYIASYGRGHGYGLYMLADTRLYGDPLIEFNVDMDIESNVALAADTQAIYQPNWSQITTVSRSDGTIYKVNVADIDSEKRVDYQWSNQSPVEGFATVVYDFPLVGCDASHSQSCIMLDGARQLTGHESFTVDLSDITLSDDLILTSRVHSAYATSMDIYVNDQWIDTQWIPSIPGYWLDIDTLIPQEFVTKFMEIRIQPNLTGSEVYAPAHHQIRTIAKSDQNPPQTYISAYQNRHILLTDFEIEQLDDNLQVTLYWYSDGKASGDYRFFVHLYDDATQPPLAQWDNYLGNSTLPPGNWLEGYRQDTITLNLDSLDSGDYEVMIGFYDSETYDRLIPLSDVVPTVILDDGRLVLQTLEIE